MIEINSNSLKMMSGIIFDVLHDEIKKRDRRNPSEIAGLECYAMYQEVNRQRRLMGKSKQISFDAVTSIYNNLLDSFNISVKLAELVLFDFAEISNLSDSTQNTPNI
jgi:hypothetical protein